MAQQPVEGKQYKDHVWPKPLLLNQALASGFSCSKYVYVFVKMELMTIHLKIVENTCICIRCDGIPRSCMNDGEGDILCNKCAVNENDVTPNKTVQKMINKLKTRCMSIIDDNEENEDAEGGGNCNVVITQIKDNQCDWTGTIQEWDQHQKECGFLVISCDKCVTYKCQRQLMTQHLAECPEMTINCPLSCGLFILSACICFMI